MFAVDLPPPQGDYARWASLVTEAFSNYGIAGPAAELQWQAWAQQLLCIDDLNNEVPRPDGFADWRSWAMRFYQNVGG